MSCKNLCTILLVVCTLFYYATAAVLVPEDLKDLLGEARVPGGANKRPCPLCDSSVCSYCSDKLFHDSCCCSSPYDHLPHQCEFADCSFLHSNSCYEHRLITQCCCTNNIFC